MTSLVTTPNLADADGFYAELLALHEGRSEAESAALNARLVLILANHVSDRAVLRQAFRLAAETMPGSAASQAGPASPET